VTPLAAEIVDWASLGEVVVVSLVVGVGVTAVFSLAVLGAVRSVDAARDGRPVVAAAFGTVALAALAGCLAAVAFGGVVMVSK
jgi:hypothetical protein